MQAAPLQDAAVEVLLDLAHDEARQAAGLLGPLAKAGPALGQDRPVFAYRLIAEDCIEEKVLELQRKKRQLADGIVPSDESVLSSLSSDELTALFSWSSRTTPIRKPDSDPDLRRGGRDGVLGSGREWRMRPSAVRRTRICSPRPITS